MTMPAPVTLTAQEIALMLGIATRAVRKRALLEQWEYQERPGNGGLAKHYLLSTLPAHIQAKYHARYKNDSKGVTPPESAPGGETLLLPSAGAASAPAGGDFLPARRRDELVRSGLAPWQNDVASARYDLCTEYLQRMETARRRKREGRKVSLTRHASDFCDAYNTGMLLPAVHEVIGAVTPKTLAKWAKKLVAGNYDMTVLAEQYGRHRKGKRSVSEAELRSMLKWALHPNKLKVSKIIHNARIDLARDGMACTASDATLRRALQDWREWNYDSWVFAREGERALKNKVLPYIERDSSLLDVGDVLVADGHPLNFRIINPWTGRPGRASLVLFFDWASRYPAGWQIMFSENIQCIHAALLRAILALGKLPRACYLDNGRAFKARVFTGGTDLRQAGVQGIYARLGILAVFAKPYNPESKVVERFFNTFNDFERLLPSYTGNSIADKPAWMMRNEKLHKKLHNPWTPTLDEAYGVISAWLLDEYATRPHSGLKSRRPVDVWLAGKGNGVDPHELRSLMMSEEITRVGRNGITFRGAHWWHEALYGYKGQALIRWDDLNMEEIDVYTRDGTDFICSARPRTKMHPLVRISDNPLDAEALKQALKQQYSLKKRTEASYRELATSLSWTDESLLPGSVLVHPASLEPSITPEEAERIRAEAAGKKVLSLVRRPDPLARPEFFKDEADAYEWMLKCALVGRELSRADREQMAAFEATELCRSLEPYWERVRNEFAEHYARHHQCDPGLDMKGARRC